MSFLFFDSVFVLTGAVISYFAVIKHPMDLATMKAKLDNKIYRDRAGFEEDFKLMIQNSKTYNAPTSFVFGEAIALEKAFNDRALFFLDTGLFSNRDRSYRMVKDRRCSKRRARARDGTRPTSSARCIDKQNLVPCTSGSYTQVHLAHEPEVVALVSESRWPARHAYQNQDQAEFPPRNGDPTPQREGTGERPVPITCGPKIQDAQDQTGHATPQAGCCTPNTSSPCAIAPTSSASTCKTRANRRH